MLLMFFQKGKGGIKLKPSMKTIANTCYLLIKIYTGARVSKGVFFSKNGKMYCKLSKGMSLVRDVLALCIVITCDFCSM